MLIIMVTMVIVIIDLALHQMPCLGLVQAMWLFTATYKDILKHLQVLLGFYYL